MDQGLLPPQRAAADAPEEALGRASRIGVSNQTAIRAPEKSLLQGLAGKPAEETAARLAVMRVSEVGEAVEIDAWFAEVKGRFLVGLEWEAKRQLEGQCALARARLALVVQERYLVRTTKCHGYYMYEK